MLRWQNLQSQLHYSSSYQNISIHNHHVQYFGPGSNQFVANILLGILVVGCSNFKHPKELIYAEVLMGERRKSVETPS